MKMHRSKIRKKNKDTLSSIECSGDCSLFSSVIKIKMKMHQIKIRKKNKDTLSSIECSGDCSLFI